MPFSPLSQLQSYLELLKQHHRYSTCMLLVWSVACTRAEAATRHQTPTSLLDKCHGVLSNCIPQGGGASLARGGRTTPRSCYTKLYKQSLHPHSTSCIKLEQNVGTRTEVADILYIVYNNGKAVPGLGGVGGGLHGNRCGLAAFLQIP